MNVSPGGGAKEVDNPGTMEQNGWGNDFLNKRHMVIAPTPLSASLPPPLSRLPSFSLHDTGPPSTSSFFCLVSNLARRNVALKCYVGALSLSLSPRMGEQEGRINIRCGSYFSQSTSTSSSVYSFHIRVIRRQVSVSILWCLFASLT